MKSARKYRFHSRRNQQIIDAAIFAVSFCLAYQIRFATRVPPASEYQMWLFLVPVTLGALAVASLFGVYHMVWRYISLSDTVLIARSHAAFSAILLANSFIVPYRWALVRIPRSIVLIQFLLALVVALGVRALRRISYEWSLGRKSNKETPARVVLVGAGDAGVLVAKELAPRPDIRPVGFLDDDPQASGTTICGLRVLGSVDCLPSVVQKHQVEEVIICVAQGQQLILRRVWALCEALPVRIRVVPTLDEILHGKLNISAFRDVDMDDLMGRERADVAFTEETAASYRGKRILITGAGGSIGSELAVQLAKVHPRELVLLDKDENGLHDACLRIHAASNGTKIQAVVADVRFSERIQGIFSCSRPEVVFHAAAHKHVPLMEVNPCEAIRNNVTGTRNVVEQALAFAVSRCVLISTDKAVKPTSIMGASKRVCEMIVQSHSLEGPGRFCCVRFGNVLGSRGSVVPIFQKQIARGEAVKLTHADVQRYLMTIAEAVSLVIQAGSLGSAGEIFVLDMGEPVLIRDLAHRLIERSGLRPGRDIPIEITQLRPGEKLSEQLFDDSTERLLPTSVAKINRIQSASFDAAGFGEKLAALELAARLERPEKVHRILGELNIGFCPDGTAPASDEVQEAVVQSAATLTSAELLARAAKQA